MGFDLKKQKVGFITSRERAEQKNLQLLEWKEQGFPHSFSSHER